MARQLRYLGRGLLRPSVLGPATALSAGYIAVGALSLWAIAAALGVHQVGAVEALSVYTFALAANLLIVVPVNLGLTELGGLAALTLFGVPRADAVAILLLQRALSGVLTGAVALTALALLREQVALALRGAPHREQTVGVPARRDARGGMANRTLAQHRAGRGIVRIAPGTADFQPARFLKCRLEAGGPRNGSHDASYE